MKSPERLTRVAGMVSATSAIADIYANLPNGETQFGAGLASAGVISAVAYELDRRRNKKQTLKKDGQSSPEIKQHNSELKPTSSIPDTQLAMIDQTGKINLDTNGDPDYPQLSMIDRMGNIIIDTEIVEPKTTPEVPDSHQTPTNKAKALVEKIANPLPPTNSSEEAGNLLGKWRKARKEARKLTNEPIVNTPRYEFPDEAVDTILKKMEEDPLQEDKTNENANNTFYTGSEPTLYKFIERTIPNKEQEEVLKEIVNEAERQAIPSEKLAYKIQSVMVEGEKNIAITPLSHTEISQPKTETAPSIKEQETPTVDTTKTKLSKKIGNWVKEKVQERKTAQEKKDGSFFKQALAKRTEARLQKATSEEQRRKDEAQELALRKIAQRIYNNPLTKEEEQLPSNQLPEGYSKNSYITESLTDALKFLNPDPELQKLYETGLRNEAEALYIPDNEKLAYRVANMKEINPQTNQPETYIDATAISIPINTDNKLPYPNTLRTATHPWIYDTDLRLRPTYFNSNVGFTFGEIGRETDADQNRKTLSERISKLRWFNETGNPINFTPEHIKETETILQQLIQEGVLKDFKIFTDELEDNETSQGTKSILTYAFLLGIIHYANKTKGMLGGDEVQSVMAEINELFAAYNGGSLKNKPEIRARVTNAQGEIIWSLF